ncbi:MAG: hypothetical protein HFH68_01380 [Lachnospiraceae bacterium]|nr:hypothetical protein [Lachnospiraceae bacterium]
MKRSISIENPSDARLTELALLAIKEDLGGSGLKGLTFDYYDYTTNSVVPNPWVKRYSSVKAEEFAERLFCVLDLEIEQKLCSQPGYAHIPRLLKQKLPNGKTLGSYGIWKHTRKPLDREGLTGIAYIPKVKNI